MNAMILAAGRGERMRPLTDHTPKPLLPVGGKPLIVWHLERLAASGFCDIVINHAHLGEQIEAALGDGSRWGVRIRYSPEPPNALETAGGIAKALPLLGENPFLVVNGDIWCDWDLRRAHQLHTPSAHLVFVTNPPEHAAGDFGLQDGVVYYANDAPHHTFTYAGIGVFSPHFFKDVCVGSALKLRPLLDAAILHKNLHGELHQGTWFDIGTPLRLAHLDAQLRHAK